MQDASRCQHCQVLWSVLAASPLASCSTRWLPDGRSSCSTGCRTAWEATAAARLKLGACVGRSLAPCLVVSAADLWVWTELCELPYCFKSVVSISGLERISAVLRLCCTGWLVPAAWCSDQLSPGVLNLCVLGVPPQYCSKRANDGPSSGGDVGDEGVVGWELGLACTIWIPPIGIIR